MLARLSPKSQGVLFFLLTALFCVSAAAQQPGIQSQEARPRTTRAYEIQVGDVLEIMFFKTPELNQSQTVGPDGWINLMLIGPVRAAERTLVNLSEEIEARYQRQLIEPELNVSIKEYSGLLVYVGGEVNQAGIVPYKGGLTLVQAIMNAGGFKETARLDQVLLMRADAERLPVGTLVNVKKILHGAEFGLDQGLQPLDVIFVPRSRIANVNRFMTNYIENILPFNFYFNPFK